VSAATQYHFRDVDYQRELQSTNDELLRCPRMRPAARRTLAATLLIAIAGAVLASCATARTGAHTVQQSPPSAASRLYDGMLGAMTRSGGIYHPTITSVTLQEPFTVSTTTELWIDVPNNRARASVRAAFGDDNIKTSEWIIEGGRWYQTLEVGPPRLREALTCRESSSTVLALVIGCRGFTEDAMVVALGEQDYRGVNALALVAIGTLQGASERTSFIDTLFVDATTMLPIALEGSGVLRPNDGASSTATRIGQFTRFEHGFVDAASLPADFFSPATIGYVDTDPAAPLRNADPDFTYYWLGHDVTAADLPPLTLEAAFVAESAARPLLRYRAILKYRLAADEFGSTMLELQEWRTDEWDGLVRDGFLAPWENDACVARIDVPMAGGGEAAIYAGYAPASRLTEHGTCPSNLPDQYLAVARTGTAVVRITAPGGVWNSEAAMRAALEAIRPLQR
jgi:hypothetical protein